MLLPSSIRVKDMFIALETLLAGLSDLCRGWVLWNLLTGLGQQREGISSGKEIDWNERMAVLSDEDPRNPREGCLELITSEELHSASLVQDNSDRIGSCRWLA
jgi:hypothetical protein